MKIKSFLKGAVSTFDLFGTSTKVESPYEGLSPSEANYKALASDWQAVGDDLRSAMSMLQVEIPIPTEEVKITKEVKKKHKKRKRRVIT